MSEHHDDFHTRWQQLQVQMHHLENDNDNRENSGQNNPKLVEKRVPADCHSHLFLQHADTYGSVIDNPTTQNGLDNFAELALAQSEGRSNESQKWTSSLTMESISEMSCVKDLLNSRETLVDLPLPMVDAKKLSTGGSTLSTTGPQPIFKSLSNQQSNQASNYQTQNKAQQNQQVLNPAKHSSVSGCKDGSAVSESGRPAGNFWNMSRQANDIADHRGGHGSGKLYGNHGNRGKKHHFNQSTKRQWEEDTPPEDDQSQASSAFRTAKEQLLDDQKKNNRGNSLSSYGSSKKSLGTRRGLNNRFVPPILRDEEDDGVASDSLTRKVTSAVLGHKGATKSSGADEIIDERLKNLDPKMVELITNEIMDHGPPIMWDDIAGLEFAKKTIKEIVVWPMLRPDIFTGLRGPPKGLLLFGPPGTGKTLIGKCIASQSKSTFFSISASSLTSKWVGEGEKMVRALFGVARVHQPSVIFIDEIDSLLSQRTDGEHEASRRIKTEFLVQLDGATTGAEDRILVVGATNRPQEIDEAARRRFMKRLYIPLPEAAARCHIVVNLISQQSHDLSPDQTDRISTQTDGYSGSDMANLCREAALGPIRSMPLADIESITADQVRPINYQDFQDALTQVRASVSQKDLDVYLDWNKQYGSWGVT